MEQDKENTTAGAKRRKSKKKYKNTIKFCFVLDLGGCKALWKKNIANLSTNWSQQNTISRVGAKDMIEKVFAIATSFKKKAQRLNPIFCFICRAQGEK